jgi:DNA-binding MarR family transcriptional regulator
MDTHEEGERIEMSRRERDRLKVLYGVVQGERSQKEAARLLRLTTRQVRRLVRRLEGQGDQGLIHRLRGRPSNRRLPVELRQQVLTEYQKCYQGFGPTLAAEKLAEQRIRVSHDTLRRWLLASGLWQSQRKREQHRQRRPRRECFGELVQMDTSIHDWLEGRGETMVLIAMIDDASGRVEAGFYPGETVESHFDLLGRWLRKNGRPLALYTDRDSIFQATSQGRPDYSGQTQFGRALRELDIDRITAYSPQAKGRVERFFGTAQDRWVKELRLAGVKTRAEANAVLRSKLLPQFNRRFTVAPARRRNAHRDLGPEHSLSAILSVQHTRSVDNDYTVRFRNRCFQLHRPAWPGLRRGKVVLEERLNGRLWIRFGDRYLSFHEIPLRPMTSVSHDVLGGSAPQTPRSLTHLRPTPVGKDKDRAAETARSSGVQPTVRRSGRTPAEPYPPNGKAKVKQTKPNRPAKNHPWRTFLLRPK